MAKNREPLITTEIYHLYNRGINHQEIYHTKQDYYRFISTAHYYQWPSELGYADFQKLSPFEQQIILSHHRQQDKRVTIYAYCLMSNHYHFLIRQEKEAGIQGFISDLTNSYSKAYAVKYSHDGPILKPRFKSKQVSDETYCATLIHYIHTNPFEANLCTAQELRDYPYSSLYESNYHAYYLVDPTMINQHSIIPDTHQSKAFLNHHQLKKLKPYLFKED